MSAVWKKVLFEGDIDITSANVSGNQADLLTGSNSGLSGGANNVLIGTDSDDVSLSVDIVGTDTITGGVDSTNDFLLIHDASAGASGELRKVSVSSLADTFASGTTDVTFTGDSGTTTALNGNASLDIEGGDGITTTASFVSGDNGKVVISANTSQTLFNPGDPINPITTAANSIMIQPHSDNFDFYGASNVLKIKTGGVGATEIENGSITNIEIADNAAISDSKLATINDTHKVDLNAVNIAGGTVAPNAQAFNVADKMVFHDVSSEIGGEGSAHNYTGTIQQFQDFISDNVGGVSNAHDGIVGAADVTGTTANLTFIEGLDFDQYGHVIGTSSATIPAASPFVPGHVTAVDQSFGGIKTFEEIVVSSAGDGNGNVTIDGNTLISGNLTVQGDTTTLNVTELSVEDKSIVGAVPATAYDTDLDGAIEARGYASAGGFFLASHHGTDVQKFAGMQWKSGNSLTGWTVANTADDNDVPADKYSIAVMDFEGTSGAPGAEQSAGVGAFLLNTADNALYIRVE